MYQYLKNVMERPSNKYKSCSDIQLLYLIERSTINEELRLSCKTKFFQFVVGAFSLSFFTSLRLITICAHLAYMFTDVIFQYELKIERL